MSFTEVKNNPSYKTKKEQLGLKIDAYRALSDD
jgi:hypothetical protein